MSTFKISFPRMVSRKKMCTVQDSAIQKNLWNVDLIATIPDELSTYRDRTRPQAILLGESRDAARFAEPSFAYDEHGDTNRNECSINRQPIYSLVDEVYRLPLSISYRIWKYVSISISDSNKKGKKRMEYIILTNSQYKLIITRNTGFLAKQSFCRMITRLEWYAEIHAVMLLSHCYNAFRFKGLIFCIDKLDARCERNMRIGENLHTIRIFANNLCLKKIFYF